MARNTVRTGRFAGSVARHATLLLLLLASFAQAAEPPTYVPCPGIGRPGHVAEDGRIQKERSPQDLAAKALDYCDIVAWGRFVSVCDENYHRTTSVLNAEVTVKFAVDETLFGERHAFIRARLSREMLVWPDTNLSWAAHGAVSAYVRRQRQDAAESGRDLLKGIYEARTPMTREQYERLSRLFNTAASEQFSVSPKETVRLISKRVLISHGGLDFTLEMGAVTPERSFLVGFSRPVEPAKGGDDFNELSTMIFWGLEAEEIAEQIRVLSDQGGKTLHEEQSPSRGQTGEEHGG